jgi:hypothetical protein
VRSSFSKGSPNAQFYRQSRFLNLVLTGLFLWPLVRTKLVNPLVRRVALRTLIAASVGLTMSTINMAVLTALDGEELSWVCLASCSLDVIANVVALFWVTGGAASMHGEASANGTQRGANDRVIRASNGLVLATSGLQPSATHKLSQNDSDDLHLPETRRFSIRRLFSRETKSIHGSPVEITITTAYDIASDVDAGRLSDDASGNDKFTTDNLEA